MTEFTAGKTFSAELTFTDPSTGKTITATAELTIKAGDSGSTGANDGGTVTGNGAANDAGGPADGGAAADGGSPVADAPPVPKADDTKADPGQQLRAGGPGKFDARGFPTVSQVMTPFWPAPSSSARLVKLVDAAMPDGAEPWPLPKWRTNSDGSRALRLCMGSQGEARLKARWNDPNWASTVKAYRGKSDAISRSLEALATGNSSLVAGAISDAMNESYSLCAPRPQLYADKAAFVLDWCYRWLSASDKQRLAGKIKSNCDQRLAKLDKQFQVHEAYYLGFHGWFFGAIAIAEESGMPDDLAGKIRNAIQHYTGWMNQSWGDGYPQTYPYQDPFFLLPPIAYGLASDQDMRQRALYLGSRAEAMLRLRSQDASRQIGFASHQACDETGLLQDGQRVGSYSMYVLADYMRSPFAQYVAGLYGRWANADDPQWISLLLQADDLAPQKPVDARIPTCRAAPISGVVSFRSGWNHKSTTAVDVNALFHVGHTDAHDSRKVGHIQIWRGDDELVSNGCNYLGSPSDYADNWGSLSFSKNCLLFQASGASEKASCQTDGSWSRSAEDMPNPVRLLWYAGGVSAVGCSVAGGTLIDYRDDGRAVIATTDLALCYDPAKVSRYTRTVVYLAPGIFLLWDRWACTGIARVRSRFFSRGAPSQAGLASTILRGSSKAVITALAGATSLRSEGGPGRECWVDGKNWLCSGSTHYCQDWLRTHPYHDPRINRNKGQYVSEFQAPPEAGEILLAIAVGGSRDDLPRLSPARREGERTIAAGGAVVHLPDETGGRQPWSAAA